MSGPEPLYSDLLREGLAHAGGPESLSQKLWCPWEELQRYEGLHHARIPRAVYQRLLDYVLEERARARFKASAG